MATVSKDGTWKLWDINVDYQRGQECHLLRTGQCINSLCSLICLAPDGRTVATASDSSISVFNAESGLCEVELREVFSGSVTRIEFDTRSRYLVACAGKALLIFHNVCGLRAIVSELEKKLPKASSPAMRERLQEQIAEARKALEEITQSAATR